MSSIIGYNGSVLKVGSNFLYSVFDTNPLDLPTCTVRFQFGYSNGMSSYNPTTDPELSGLWKTGSVWKQVSAHPTNIWDYTRVDSDWDEEFMPFSLTHTVDDTYVLGANTTGITNMHAMFRGNYVLRAVKLFDTSSVTNMSYMFDSCHFLGYNIILSPVYNKIDGGTYAVPAFDMSRVTTTRCMFSDDGYLTQVPLWDTSSVTDMSEMFGNSGLHTVPLFNTSSVTTMYNSFLECRSLTNIPLFDTTNVTDIRDAFYNCTAVESGALELYNQASTQTTPPTYYSGAFLNCGANTTSGAAELAQIPSSWGGTGT